MFSVPKPLHLGSFLAHFEIIIISVGCIVLLDSFFDIIAFFLREDISSDKICCSISLPL